MQAHPSCIFQRRRTHDGLIDRVEALFGVDRELGDFEPCKSCERPKRLVVCRA